MPILHYLSPALCQNSSLYASELSVADPIFNTDVFVMFALWKDGSDDK